MSRWGQLLQTYLCVAISYYDANYVIVLPQLQQIDARVWAEEVEPSGLLPHHLALDR